MGGDAAYAYIGTQFGVFHQGRDHRHCVSAATADTATTSTAARP